ncbi:hypothetical protein ALP03_102280 [Pseudomonas amygdali pv. tabaci]|uniref:Uncharacterized protein n=1 Tax=Pseudomonas amygdali pv. tabaci TaxID=322 RepID=A0A3M6FN46_PSEAJ|nr:hypothetical protein ALP03_102280 [Pseudomonas amygdali pv. tabaci]
MKNTTDGRVILSSSSAINDSTPGRCQPTVELDVPKSMPQARAGDWSFMSFTFQSKNGRAVYVSARQLRSATRRLYLLGCIYRQGLN